MPTSAVRCPYCVQGNAFKLMIAQPDGCFICNRCGHSTLPGQSEYICHCERCVELGQISPNQARRKKDTSPGDPGLNPILKD